jgi:hypothetical protein
MATGAATSNQYTNIRQSRTFQLWEGKNQKRHARLSRLAGK